MFKQFLEILNPRTNTKKENIPDAGLLGIALAGLAEATGGLSTFASVGLDPEYVSLTAIGTFVVKSAIKILIVKHRS